MCWGAVALSTSGASRETKFAGRDTLLKQSIIYR
jgi:hypothetical protein